MPCPVEWRDIMQAIRFLETPLATELRASPWRIAEEHADFPREAFAELLAFPGSLTAELTRLGHGDFSLQVSAQANLASDDSGALLPHEDAHDWLPGLCREVMMFVRGRPAVAARTLVPEATARAQGWLGELGGRSLGHALFERDDVTRSPFEFASCRSRSHVVERVRSLHPQALTDLAPTQVLWARRSRFAVGGCPLLVMELFLPEAAALTKPVASAGVAQ